MRTVIYARYSSTLQNSRSIADQVAVCRDRAAREGWTIVGTFEDAAISGAAGIDEAQRPGLNAMLDMVARGGVDRVLAESTDRIARHLGDAIAIREQIEFAGARLFTLSDGEVDDITGTFKGMMDARFRKEMGAKIKRGQRGSVAQGRAPAGIAYGYRQANRLTDRGTLERGLREIDEAQAAIVRRIFAEYDAGDSPRRIAERLNAEGVPAPRGATWRTTTILGDRQRQSGILKNRLYIGCIVLDRTSKPTNPRTRKTVIRPNAPDQWITGDAPHLRILDDALFDRVQARIEQHGLGPSHLQRRPRHLLSGLGTCAVCGSNYVLSNLTQWNCGRARDGAGCSNGASISTRKYVRAVLQGLKDGMAHPDVIAAYFAEYKREATRAAGEGARERAKLERRRAEAQRKIERLTDAIASGAGEFEEVRTAMAAARAERAGADAALAAIRELPVIAIHPGMQADYRRQVENLEDVLAGADEQARAEAMPQIRAMIGRILLTPKATGRGVDVRVEGKMEYLLGLATAGEVVKGKRRANN